MKDCPPKGAVIVTTPQQVCVCVCVRVCVCVCVCVSFYLSLSHTHTKVSLGTIRREITFCRKLGVKIVGLIENMSGYACPCCGVCMRERGDTHTHTHTHTYTHAHTHTHTHTNKYRM